MSIIQHGIGAEGGGGGGGARFSFPPLKRDNWDAWYGRMKGLLNYYGYMNLVEGRERRPVNPPDPIIVDGVTTNAAIRDPQLKLQADWDQKALKAAFAIVSALTDEIFLTVKTVSEDPVRIWDQLKKRFNRKSDSRASEATIGVLDFQHEPEETADDLLSRFASAMEFVEQQDVTITDVTQHRSLLHNVPERYAHIKQHYAMTEPKPDFDWIQNQLRDADAEYQRTRKSGGKATGAALRAEMEAFWYANKNKEGGAGTSTKPAKPKKPDKEPGKVKGECFKCGEKGHWAKSCPQKNATCENCGMVGHVKKTCRQPKKEVRQFDEERGRSAYVRLR
jgi:hypothetical protein